MHAVCTENVSQNKIFELILNLFTHPVMCHDAGGDDAGMFTDRMFVL